MGNVTISYDEDGTIKIVDGNAVPKETASIGSKVTKDANGKSVASFDEKFKTSLEISNYYPTGSMTRHTCPWWERIMPIK